MVVLVRTEQLDAMRQAMEAAEDQRRKQNLRVWWTKFEDQIGQIDPFTLNHVIEIYKSEAERSGIDRDDRLFLYLAARRLMPNMSGEQYLLVMDAVFDRASDESRLQTILNIGKLVNP